jgi:hypothetical protein
LPPRTEGPRYPCIGIYTLGTEVIGVRLAESPLVDGYAQDVAVLIR